MYIFHVPVVRLYIDLLISKDWIVYVDIAV